MNGTRRKGREMMDRGFVKGGRKKREGFSKNKFYLTTIAKNDSRYFFIDY